MAKSNVTSERVLDLGNGLTIWKTHLDFLREQDKNARVMSPEKFHRLVNNISKDKRLESMPLCVLESNEAGNQQLAIISGHHRTRAARSAGVSEIFVMVYENLTVDEVKAKQLAHNALNGQDDADMLREIYDSITDIEQKIASGVIDVDLNYDVDRIKASQPSIYIDYEMFQIFFLPAQKENFDDVIAAILTENVGIAEMAQYHKLKQAMQKVSKAENIRSMSAIFNRMIMIIKEHYAKQAE